MNIATLLASHALTQRNESEKAVQY